MALAVLLEEGELRPLLPGQLLRGEVLADLGGGHYQLRFGARDLIVNSQVPLETGRDQVFQVLRTGPQIALRRVALENSDMRLDPVLITRALSVGESLDEVLERVFELLRHEAPASSRGRAIAARLAGRLRTMAVPLPTAADDLVDLSAAAGLPLEARLRVALEQGRPREHLLQILAEDPKALALQLLRELSAPAERSSPLAEETARLVEKYLSRELLNAVRREEGLPWHFEVPLRDGERQLSADIYYHEPEERSRASGESPRRLVLQIRLHSLGEVQADLLLRGKALDVRFRAGAEAAGRIRLALPELEEALRGDGLTLAARQVEETGAASAPAGVDLGEGVYLDLIG